MRKIEIATLILILGLTAFLRLYRIDGYMTFLGDEGRDALVVRDIVNGTHFPLLGPPTSIGNMYLGPLYYYMMAIPFFLTNSNPISAAVMIALIGVATVWLIYYLTKAWFGFGAAVIASLLYSISPVTIVLFRSSWNPHPAPFFALLTILGFYLSRLRGNYAYLIISGASLAFSLQMHYLALILLPVVFVIWSSELRKNRSLTKNDFLLYSSLSLVVFLLLMSPLAFFDIRHNFLNTRAIINFFSGSSSVSFNILASLVSIPNIFINPLIGRYMVASIEPLAILVSLVVLLTFYKRHEWSTFIMGVWLGFGLLGLSFYKQDLFDHYLGFLNPVPFILFGAAYSLAKKTPLLLGYIFIVVIVIVVNIINSPLRIPPNYQLKRTQDIARYIISQTNGKSFNFALLSARNYDSAYQFYLEQFNHKPAQVPFVIADQLFVVCEDTVCQPINNPKYEIAAFGWSKIVKEQNFEGVKVFKLVHNYLGTR